jgi:NAD(P)H-dependent FMN reductase
MKYLVFLGSVRESTPPHPKRLGMRVAMALTAQLNTGENEATLIDPLQFELGGKFKPHFAHMKDKAPEPLEQLATAISTADGYIMVSPEYNHSMSPALAHLLNHFGSSLYSFKPSVIATYSAGQWGGVRAAQNMRGFLSELGCLPVSAMIHVPKAQEVFDDCGQFLNGVDGQAWTTYIDRAIAQLDWWAAAKSQRSNNTVELPPAFTKDPKQRNAP